MRERSLAPRRWLGWTPLFVLLVLALAGCAENYPQTTLTPKGDFAQMADDVFMTTVRWAIIVFVLVEGALVFAIIRYRGKPEDAQPNQVHGNTTLEVVWTAIPAIILVIIAVPTIRTIFETAKTPSNGALIVEVVGHQWWWEFRYPEYGITTANELHVPVGRTVDFRMESHDVIHSFWVPQFAGKRDVFPGRETRIWFTAETAGSYPGQCAEFCGIQHGKMAFRIIASEPAEFEAWTAAMGAATDGVPVADSTSLAAQGAQLWLTKGCLACHTFNAASPPPGMIGPNLANIGARQYIVAGTLPNTPENLANWIQDPESIKQGSLMRLPVPVNPQEAEALAAYLATQRVTNGGAVLADPGN